MNRREICNGNGNVESWRVKFFRDSPLRWHVRNLDTKHARSDALERDPVGPPVGRLRRGDEVQTWFDEVRHELERAG